MADDDTPTWEPTTVRCGGCHVEAEAEHYGSTVTTLPPGWMVGDPGTDEGSVLLCSKACAVAWVTAEAAAWEASSPRMQTMTKALGG